MVPMAQPQTSAVSAYDKPTTWVSTNASRRSSSSAASSDLSSTSSSNRCVGRRSEASSRSAPCAMRGRDFR
ncbi:Uncharacterised protein [Mycobacteroides abscessus subsp. abscessus]|nr:Uncharacterised protein [Mycobacteroides abscessus subsp. abscessus]